MFVETNDIEFVIVNIDGLISIDDERNLNPQSIINSEIDVSRISIEGEITEALRYIDDQSNIKLVSSFPESQLREILATCFSPPLEVETFSALSDLEQLVPKWPIYRALESCETKTCNCVYICGDTRSIQQAQSLRLGTIFWNHEEMDNTEMIELLTKGPDFMVNESSNLIDIFEKRYLGHLGEVAATPLSFFSRKVPKQYVRTLSFPNREYPDYPIHVSGRYFKKDDPRFKKHALSRRILDSKNNMERQKRNLTYIISWMISYLVDDEFDFVTRVPPKPTETEDRIREGIEYLEEVEFKGKKIRKDKIKPDLLTCLRDYVPQKDAGSHSARRDNVRGVFGIREDVNGQTIIVVDDITTSGSTFMEITKLILDGGAKNVIPLALSYHPGNLHPSEEYIGCPQCEDKLVPRHNNKNGDPFFGCNSYHTTNCRGSMSFVDGVRELNENIGLAELEELEDVEL